MVRELRYAAQQYLILPIPDLQDLSISWALPGEKNGTVEDNCNLSGSTQFQVLSPVGYHDFQRTPFWFYLILSYEWYAFVCQHSFQNDLFYLKLMLNRPQISSPFFLWDLINLSSCAHLAEQYPLEICELQPLLNPASTTLLFTLICQHSYFWAKI